MEIRGDYHTASAKLGAKFWFQRNSDRLKRAFLRPMLINPQAWERRAYVELLRQIEIGACGLYSSIPLVHVRAIDSIGDIQKEGILPASAVKESSVEERVKVAENKGLLEKVAPENRARVLNDLEAIFGSSLGTNTYDYDVRFGLDNFVFLTYGHIYPSREADVIFVIHPKVLNFDQRGTIATFHDIAFYNFLVEARETIEVFGRVVESITMDHYLEEIFPAEDLGVLALLTSVWMNSRKTDEPKSLEDLLLHFYRNPWKIFREPISWKLVESAHIPFNRNGYLPFFEIKVPRHIREDEILFGLTDRDGAENLVAKGFPEHKICEVDSPIDLSDKEKIQSLSINLYLHTNYQIGPKLDTSLLTTVSEASERIREQVHSTADDLIERMSRRRRR